MIEVLSEDRFDLCDQQSVRVAIARMRCCLLELKLSEVQVSKLLTVSSELSSR